MKVAVWLRDINKEKDRRMSLYLLSHRMKDFEGHIVPSRYVIVSAVCNELLHETFIFESNSEGEFINYSELPGSSKNVFSHKFALAAAGYILLKP